MPSSRRQIINFLEQGAIPPEKTDEALAVSGITPDAGAWKTFIDHLLLWLGGLALACAAVFFIAYNWSEIGRLGKFAMVEGLIILTVLAYWKLGDRAVAGKVALLVATILLGVLLALFGQTYQTGADPWQLFFTWALLMLPWAVVGRFPAIWVVWIVLINLAIVLYHQAFRGVFGLMFGSDNTMLWLTFAFNALALTAWELLSKPWPWLAERWAVRLLAVGSGVPLTWLVLYGIAGQENALVSAGTAWAVWMAVMYIVYRQKRPDLFMLAGCCLSGIVVVVTFLGRHLLAFSEAGAFLFLALVVIGLGAGAAVWLRNVHREWQS
jgi:uncharacterized membrane protein